MGSLQGKRVLVTGASGFLGRHVVEELYRVGVNDIIAPSRRHCDFLNAGMADDYIKFWKPDCIIHLAARCGGIGANAKEPGEFLFSNAQMALNAIDSAARYDVPKFVAIGSVCMYPKHCPVPFREDDIWNGYPEETNAPYGVAKRLLLELCQAYRKQFGFSAITLIPANLYGPGDNFDLETSHVIPVLIRKAIEANEHSLPELLLWGDGSPTREFLHVRDAARAIVMAAAEYDSPEPVNIGTGVETSIRKVAWEICKATEYRGDIAYSDGGRMNGQPRRCLDVSRAKQFGFEAQISLEDGIRETVEWYKANRCEVAA